MAKNFTKIIAVLILSFLLFQSCRQDVGINKDQNPSRAEEFFKNRNESSKTVNPTFVSGLINRLERINKSHDFLSTLSDKSGLPIWNYAIEARVKKYDRFTQRDGDIEEMIIIPLKKNSNYLSSLMYVENPNSDSPKIYTVTNSQLKTFVYNQNIDSSIRERILMTFIYFDNTIFGRNGYGEIPLDLFPKVFASEVAEKKSFQIEKMQTSPDAREEEICYTLLHCKNGVNENQCDHCSKCETFFCLIFAGGEVDNGDDGGPIDNNGDGGYGGGGDGSGSGGGNPENPDPCSDPSSPWYTHHSCGNNTGSGTSNNSPCQKTQALLSKPQVQSAITNLKSNAVNGTGEKGVMFKADGTPSAMIQGGDHSVNFGDKSGYQGGYHNHTPTGIPMLSPGDFDQLLSFALGQGNLNVSNAYLGMVAPNGMHYVIRFAGNYSDATMNFDQAQINNCAEFFKDRNDFYSNDSQYSNDYINLNSDGLEKIFFETIKEMGLTNKITLIRIEDNNNNTVAKIITQNNDGSITATPCP